MLARGIEAAKNFGVSMVSKEARNQRMVDKFDNAYASIKEDLEKLGCKLMKNSVTTLETGRTWSADQSHRELSYVLSAPLKHYSKVRELLRKAKIKTVKKDSDSLAWKPGNPDRALFTILKIKSERQYY